MAVAAYKEDWIVCNSCFCENSYLICPPSTCCFSDLQVCLCMGGDCAFPNHENVPLICTCLPCCTIYPKVACCTTPRQLEVENIDKLGRKADFMVCDGNCLFCCASNNYCFSPYTCCADEGSQFLCCGSDCAIPCSDTIPFAFALYGIMCVPQFGCCVRTGQAFDMAK
uniref:Uncharacterized protein n=1 Tax=Pinguiococcus pyrenoidosus TaxID=172671 RepID=A0A6U0TG83_9STRA|mmetsp:Transcript_11506/g.42957  ORF Transcript_11506/g.42957 Transcript_11506/m.42957 type:complete len:168 (+) Transcript_11506:85-588(+)